MKKLFMFCLLNLLVITPCFATNYQVLSIDKTGQAFFKDRDSKRTCKAGVGQALDSEWSVVSIGQRFVVIEKWLNEEEAVRGVLPIPNRGQFITVKFSSQQE